MNTRTREIRNQARDAYDLIIDYVLNIDFNSNDEYNLFLTEIIKRATNDLAVDFEDSINEKEGE